MEGVSRRPRLRVVVYVVNLRRTRRTYGARTQTAPFRHGGTAWAPRVRLSVSRRTQNAPFRDVAAPRRCGTTPRQAAGHYGKRPNWANALEQPPASLRGGLRQGLQISVRSLASRKGALCPTCGLQNALFREAPAPDCAFPSRRSCRMRLSVECAFPHLGKRGAAPRKSAVWDARFT